MEPPGLLLGLALFVLILLTIGLLWFISRTKAWLRGEPFLTAQRFQQAAEPRTPRTEAVNPRSEPQQAIVQNAQRANVQDEPADFEPPNADELRRLGDAIRHNAGGATKQQALEIAFGVKKGGSAGWRRASQLFDAATAPPPDPFPHLHAQQLPRWEPETKKA